MYMFICMCMDVVYMCGITTPFWLIKYVLFSHCGIIDMSYM